MSIEFILPELGENIETADVVEVLVAVGDSISVDDPILEIETDKATFEVPSSVSGTVTELHVAPGEKARVGQVVMVVQEDAGVPAGEGSAAPEASPPAEQPTTEGAQEQSEASQPAVAVESAPAEARASVDLTSEREPAAEETSVNGTSSGPRELAPAAPSTRRLAREIGVDIGQVRGTGPHGRISIADVKNHAKQLLSRGPSAAPAAGTVAAGPPVVPLPDFSKYGSIRREGMSNVRRKTAQQMHLAWSTIPQVTQFDKADITDLEALRKRLNASGELSAKLTVTAILLKVIGTALKKFPQFNASIDMANEEIVYKDYFNVGVAVDTERGLLVPVVRDVNDKNIAELAGDLNTVAAKARDKKIRPDDLQGACITITNLGGIGGHAFTPIVNPPEVAILGVSRASKQPVFYEDAFYARLVMPLCLSYDHRLIDGADAARFLRWVCETLENPALLAFES